MTWMSRAEHQRRLTTRMKAPTIVTSRGIRVYVLACLALGTVACAGSEDLEKTGDSGAKAGRAGTSPSGTGGGPPGTGGSGGGGTTTGGAGTGGSTGRGGSGGTGTGAGGTGGTTGTGGTGTGGSGGTGTGGSGGGIQDAGAMDDRPNAIDAGTCTTCKLRVQYKASDTNAADNQIKPHFNIVNVGTTSIPLRELTIRYWYTVDGDRSQSYSCDYAMLGCSNVTGRFVKLTTPEQGADSYLEIGFAAGAGTLSANGQSGEIQNRVNKDNFSNYNEADDYSFDPARTAFTDWMRVTLYHNGGLVWGIDPECANPRDGSTCAGDGGPIPDASTGDASTDGASTDVSTPDIATPDAEGGPTDAGSGDGSGNDASTGDGGLDL
jgi:Cellulose binding domain